MSAKAFTDVVLHQTAGRIVMSDNPPAVMRELRKALGVRVTDLAHNMQVPLSTISDYERGRRPSPGANFIKRYVEGLFAVQHASN